MRLMNRWFEANGENSDVVISSRVRLARNLPQYNFSHKLKNSDAKRMVDDTLMKIKEMAEFESYSSYNFENLDQFQKIAMLERHVISPFLINQNVAAGLVSPDENISIMLNEEDHIRIQAFVAGSDMETAYKNADVIDDCLSNVVEYAYNSKYGYLTTCPSNVGTGMRASYMLHLPALSGTNKLNGLASEIGRFGLTIRSIYGEGTRGLGDIYQISNQVTLGFSEGEIIDNLSNIVYQIIQQERTARRQYISRKRVSAEDVVYRSYGVLKYSRKISIKDAMALLSELRMGLEQGLLKVAKNDGFTIYNIMIGIQPANLQLIAERELTEEEIDIGRAKFIRENLPLIQ